MKRYNLNTFVSAIYTLPLYPFCHAISHLSRGAFVSITIFFPYGSHTHGSYLLGVKSFNPFFFLGRSFAHSLRCDSKFVSMSVPKFVSQQLFSLTTLNKLNTVQTN